MTTGIPKDAPGDRWLQRRLCILLTAGEAEMGTIRQSPLSHGKPSQAAELHRRSLQWEAFRSRAQERKVLTALQEGLQVPVKPQSPLIWLFTHLDTNEEKKAREDRIFQRKERRRRKEKVETDLPPEDGPEAQISVQAQKRRKHLFIFVGWKEEEEAREQRRLRRLVKRRLFTFPEWRELEKEK
ncbi:hypothetical protein lerEdw1_010106, partial [Lerista edwardsae]